MGGGIERYVHALEGALRRTGTEVTRLDLYRPDAQGLLRQLSFTGELAEAIVRNRPSHIFAMHRNLFRLAGTFARLARSWAVGWIYGAEVFSATQQARTAAALVHVSTVGTISEFSASALLDVKHAEQQLHIIRPALDPEWWELTHTIRASRSPEPRLVVVSRLDTDDLDAKGVWDVVELAGALRTLHPALSLVVVGDGPRLDEFRERARRSGADEFCTFRGKLTDADLVRELKKAWVFVLPSKLDRQTGTGEGFGIVFIEAASAGTPVVGSTHAGAREAVAHGVGGFAVDPCNRAALIRACSRIIEDPSLRESMSKANEEWAAEHFSPDRIDRDVRSFLVDCPRRGRRRLRPG
jgi:glycosyltransferase involved in cell wall biosynthesis